MGLRLEMSSGLVFRDSMPYISLRVRIPKGEPSSLPEAALIHQAEGQKQRFCDLAELV